MSAWQGVPPGSLILSEDKNLFEVIARLPSVWPRCFRLSKSRRRGEKQISKRRREGGERRKGEEGRMTDTRRGDSQNTVLSSSRRGIYLITASSKDHIHVSSAVLSLEVEMWLETVKGYTHSQVITYKAAGEKPSVPLCPSAFYLLLFCRWIFIPKYQKGVKWQAGRSAMRANCESTKKAVNIQLKK